MLLFNHTRSHQLTASAIVISLITLSTTTMAASPPTPLSTPVANIQSAENVKQAPIPVVNTPYFQDFVRRYHTFPSPFGYEPYRDQKGEPVSFPINVLNKQDPYIPVTFYCHSRDMCPNEIVFSSDRVQFIYPDQEFLILFARTAYANAIPLMMGFYFPNDPMLYRLNQPLTGRHPLNNVGYGDPLVTILFSQRLLRSLQQQPSGGDYGYLAMNNGKSKMMYGYPVSYSPLADGTESIKVGTTLGLITHSQASGMQFTATFSQTTGESTTKQVQTGFTVGYSVNASVTVGGQGVPVSGSLSASVNKTLSEMVSNSLTLSDLKTTSRTYAINPGINDTYYWGIYQLLYSYYLDAPLFEGGLKTIQSTWKDLISYQIAGNELTEDGKRVGNLLPPQESGLANDITIPVAVQVYPDASGRARMIQTIVRGNNVTVATKK